MLQAYILPKDKEVLDRTWIMIRTKEDIHVTVISLTHEVTNVFLFDEFSIG